MNEKILIFGTGQGAEKVIKTIENFEEIIGFIDMIHRNMPVI